LTLQSTAHAEKWKVNIHYNRETARCFYHLYIRKDVPTHKSHQRFANFTPGQLSLAIRAWVEAMSTSERAVTPCGWGVKFVCEVAGKTVRSPCYTRAIS